MAGTAVYACLGSECFTVNADPQSPPKPELMIHEGFCLIESSSSPPSQRSKCQPRTLQQAVGGVDTLTHCRRLLAQLDTLGWRHVARISPDLQSITLSLRDTAGRQHDADVSLPAGWPAAAPHVDAQLPWPWRPRWRAGDSLVQFMPQLEQVREWTKAAQHNSLRETLVEH